MIAMSATYPYTEEKLQDSNLQANISEDIEQIIDQPEINELEMQDGETENAQKSTNRSTTDLVRLYLQEIGRVDLLERDQEISEAKKVKHYVELLELLNKSATEEEGVIQSYVRLVEIRNRLTAQLGHRPSLERWAKAADIPVAELKPTLAAGKLRWAELAGLSVKELEKAQSDGIKAKDHMINANLRLVVSVAKKYQNRGLELLDLIQEGTLGLERAVEKFDPRRGYRFSTYAYWWIRQGITRAIATQSRTIRLPVHITEKLNKIKKAQRKISQEKGRIAKLEDIAQELNMTPTQVREVLLKVPRSISLETKVGSDKDTELGELLETEDASPEEMLMRESLIQALRGLLEDLTQREKSVISMRYGLGDGNPYSLSEIGRSLKLSRERVRQIEAKALQKLRQPKRRSQVQDYLESLT